MKKICRQIFIEWRKPEAGKGVPSARPSRPPGGLCSKENADGFAFLWPLTADRGPLTKVLLPLQQHLFCIPKPVPITRYIWYNKLYDIYREDGEAHA